MLRLCPILDGKYQDKLISPTPCDKCLGADMGLKYPRHLDKKRIAHTMTVGIIYLFKTIHI